MPKLSRSAVPKLKLYPNLPKYIRESDFKEPSYRGKDLLGWEHPARETVGSSSIELWHTERFGWVIPTLTIRNASYRHGGIGATRRTYAIGLDGTPCRVGFGPHVTHQLRIYLKKSNVKRLQPMLDLIAEGQVKANDTRDRISTRRAFSRARY